MINSTTAEHCRRYKGIVLSGSPHSVLEENRPGLDSGILALGIPILGLCYGHQLLAQSLGGTVVRGVYREYGKADMRVISREGIFAGLDQSEHI